VLDPLSELDLTSAGVTSIVWATGFVSDYGWLQVDAFDEGGKPRHARGVSSEPGIYFLGLPWQSRRGSSFIWGVWHDAAYVAEHIAIQRGYLAYDNVDGSLDPRHLTADTSELDLGEKPVVTATGAA
jgi:putative flavoprotein involved in K+ transport